MPDVKGIAYTVSQVVVRVARDTTPVAMDKDKAPIAQTSS